MEGKMRRLGEERRRGQESACARHAEGAGSATESPGELHGFLAAERPRNLPACELPFALGGQRHTIHRRCQEPSIPASQPLISTAIRRDAEMRQHLVAIDGRKMRSQNGMGDELPIAGADDDHSLVISGGCDERTDASGSGDKA
jgi:hypothetical protein